MRYLDPKNDLVFKRVFGQHPDLLISFLNALLPLPDDGLIESLEYLPAEQVPEVPLFKNSIVDVRCRDARGRQFIVEMQLLWTDAFMHRVVFNASKAYVRQLERGEHYELLQPVYALSIVNDVFEKQKDDFYHHYQIVNVEDPSRQLEGLEFVFVELPKFRPERMVERRLNVLWLRFLQEIKDGTESLPEGLDAEPALRKATELVRESAFTRAELDAYDRFWDGVSRERTLMGEAYRDGIAKGYEDGIAKGYEDGIEQGIEQGLVQAARRCLQRGLSAEETAEITGLSPEQVRALAGG